MLYLTVQLIIEDQNCKTRPFAPQPALLPHMRILSQPSESEGQVLMLRQQHSSAQGIAHRLLAVTEHSVAKKHARRLAARQTSAPVPELYLALKTSSYI